jgi:hypothetical protein
VILVGLLIGVPGAPPGYAQAPAAGGGPPPAPLSAQQLEELVGRIALYPDDLVAIILPASTFPLDVVQADRFLQKLKQDKNLKPDARWDESIRNLLNYPEVISMMSQDLDWTQDLGEAMVGQQSDVLKAIQAFRAKAQTAGSLKTDDKQIIVQEKEVIKIVPADPEVIYVPQYQPSVVVVQAAPPVYYPTPYPSYYYPYPPGAAFATGVFFGAALAYGANWGGGHVENNVNINNTSNFNTNRVNPQNQQKVNQGRQQAQQRAQQPGQGGRGQAGASQWQSQKRPGEVSQGRVSPQTAQARSGYGGGGASKGDAFGSGGRGSDAMRDSSRGAQSRGASASTMDRGGAQPGGGSRGGASASTMDRGGSRGGGGSASMGGGGSRGGGGGGGGSRGGGGGGGGGSRGGGGGGGRR